MSKRLLIFLAVWLLAAFSYAAFAESKIFDFSRGISSVKETLVAAETLIKKSFHKRVFDAPIALFTHNSSGTACGTETIQFNNTSVNASTYFWDFGDGITSIDKNPAHQFKADFGGGEQIFYVKLKASNSDNITAEVSFPVKIKRMPDATLDGTGSLVYNGLPYFRVCANVPSSLNFTNQSTTKTDISAYKIDWGDGSGVYSSNVFDAPVSHLYAVGTHTLTYTVIGINGCENTTKYYVFVGSNPAGNIVPRGSTEICTDQSLTFDILGIDNNPPGTVYTISFNDGSDPVILIHPLVDKSITHIFKKGSCGTTTMSNGASFPNSFAVFFEAKNPCGLTPGFAGGIYVSEKPKASFVIDKNNIICENTTLSFTSTSKGNKASASGCAPGKLIWTVEPLNGGPADGYSTSSNLGNEFGLPNDPGSWASGTNTVNLLFVKAGKYKVSLKIAGTDQLACGPDIYSEEICVNPKPLASFTLPITSGCAPFTLRATNTSNTPLLNCGTNTYKWTVTDVSTGQCNVLPTLPTYINGTNSTSESPEFSFTKPGVYRIGLIVRNTAGVCVSAEFFQDVTVKTIPVADINLSRTQICEGQSIDATAILRNCYAASATYEWEFPSSNTPFSSLASPKNVMYATPGIYPVRLKVTNECGTNSVVYTSSIIVNETPQLKAIADIIVCNGTLINVPTFATVSGIAATYTWTNNNTSIGLAGSGNGAISFRGVNNTLAPTTATVKVIATSRGCASTVEEFKITINPGAQVSNAGADQDLCFLTTTTLDGSIASQGGEWTLIAGPAISFTDKTDPKTAITGLQAGQTYTLRWTVNGFNPCPSTSDNVIIKISPETVAGTTSGANSYCGTSPSGTITLAGQTGVVVRWEKSTGSGWTSITPNNTTTSLIYNNLTVTTSYRAVVKSGNCVELTSSSTEVIVKTLPIAPSAMPSYEYCLSEVATALTATGTGLKWYMTTFSPGNLLPPAPTPATNVAGTFNYYVTQTVDGCESLPTTITVKVNPAIANNSISADQVICLGTLPATLIGTAATGGKPNVYNYQWQSSPDGLEASYSNINGETALNYQPVAITVDTYYRRVVTSGSCSSVSNLITITVQGSLNNTTISSDQTICSGSIPLQIDGEIPTGGNGVFNYVWAKSTTSASVGFTNIAGAIGANYQPPVLTQTTYYRRTVSSGPCSGISNIIVVNVNPIPVLEQLDKLTICNGQAVPITAIKADLTGSQVSFDWSNDNIAIGLPAGGAGDLPAFTATNGSKQPIAATIKYSATYTGDGVACKTVEKSFVITVLPSITIISNLPDLTVCNGAIVAEVNMTNDAFTNSAVTYRWESSESIGLVNGSGVKIPAFTSVNMTTAPLVSTITVTPQYAFNGKLCDGVPTTYQITVTPSPNVAFSIPDQIVCSNSSTTQVTLSSTSSTVNFKWTAMPVQGITGLATAGTDKIPIQTLINSTTAPITVTYIAVANTSGNTNCDGLPSEYRITVNPRPQLTVSSTTKTICSGTNPSITLSSNVAATTFTWTVSANTNISGAADGAGNTLNQVLTNNSTLPQVVIYTITPKYLNGAADCDGMPVIVTITVNPAPQVNFSSVDDEICSGQLVSAVQLTSTTGNAKISWTAIVPQGITGVVNLTGTNTIDAQTLVNSTDVPLTVIYKAVAKTDDVNACSGTVSEYKITVNPIARLTNTILQQEICSNTNTTKVVLTSNVSLATYSWVATASSANVTGFATNGTGDIPAQQLVNSGPNIEKVTFNIAIQTYNCDGVPGKYEILVYPTPIFTSSLAPSEICSGTLFSYLPTSSTANVNFKWSRAVVAGISNAGASGSGIDAAGAISETLINTTINAIDVTYEYEMTVNGCASGIKYPLVVKVNPQTTAKFGLSEINGCAPFNLVIKNLNSRALASTYTVDFGDGSPIAVYTDTRDILHTYENGTNFVKLFYIRITTKNDCGESISVPFEIRVQPQTVFSKLVLNATQTFGCAPLLVDFTTTNQSTGANLFTWDFGDGSPIQQTRVVNEKLTHTYVTAGDYTVTLTATNGCSTVSTTEVITVYPQVNASFSIDKLQVCVGTDLSFTNTSDTQFTALWDFGDGTTSTALNPKHNYLTPGLKTITLRSTKVYPNGGSCTAITTRTVQVLAAPVSEFTTNASSLNCGPFKLNVSATATNISNITWDFGDSGQQGNTAVGSTVSYTYTRAGDYVVTATAYNAEGCVSTTTKLIRVTESPLADFSTQTQQFCGRNADVNFRNETTYGGTDAINYKWLVNNSAVATTRDLNYRFEVPVGVALPYLFKVKLEATNMAGCTTIMEKDIQFNPFPKAVFNITQPRGCVPFKLEITNQSVDANQYEWFLDGTLVSNLRVPDNIILAEFNRVYNLKLLVKNQYGCTENEQITQVSTYPLLRAAFTLADDLSCNGVLDLQITNQSEGATTYTWDYGDESPVYVGSNPTHSYGKPGVYTIKLTAGNGFCTDVFTKNVTVSSAPKAAFLSDVKTGCNQLTVKFENTSVNSTEFYWDFGDGTFSREENPEHQYIYSATPYTVKLKVSNNNGCSDETTATNFISVFPPPEADILITPNKIIKVPNFSFTFKATTTENIISYKWDFGDGQTSDKQETIHKYDRFGTYKIKLYLTNIANCTNVIEDEVTILDFPGYLFIPNAFEPENLNNDLKVFKVKGSGMATYNFKVFNKWGQMIWQTYELDDQGAPVKHWDGTEKGQLLPLGAYFWQAEATFINGEVWKGMKYGNRAESKNGVIHLIR